MCYKTTFQSDSAGKQLTNVGALHVIAERQNFAHRFGISLLHQQLNDGLPIGFNQVLALARQSGWQVIADRLDGFDHLLLKRAHFHGSA